MKSAFYEEDYGNVDGCYKVTFLIKETGKRFVRGFSSPYQARLFVNKLKHSKKCMVISHPIFD